METIESLFVGDKLPPIIPFIGLISPILVSIIAVTSLWKQPFYIMVYLFFSIINHGINHLLKSLIKEPRPSGGKTILKIESYEGAEQYGMPSAHSQGIAYSIVFLFLVKRSSYLLFIELLLAATTIYQRYTYNRHTLLQLGVGALVGAAVAYTSLLCVNTYITSQ